MKGIKSMPPLTDYNQFEGRHHETGTVQNFLAYTGARAPHTGEPYSEALLLGVSGGIVMGYFTFAYKGYDPHVALLTRNTFDPFDTMLSRLGVERDVRQTNKAEKGIANLVDALEDGSPAIVWADMWSMPYNDLPFDEGMWGSFPLIVYGYDEEADCVRIADRAGVSLTVTTGDLEKARARIKKDKFRLLTLDIPDPDKLPTAVSSGLRDCIKLFTEKPPRGSAKNFGLAAYRNWIELLTNPKNRQSWEKEFPAGSKMYAGLISAFDRMGKTGVCGDADRGLYAEFLEESSSILGRKGLQQAGEQFRASSAAWRELGITLLPDSVPLFKETRKLTGSSHELFVQKGNAALPEIRKINRRLVELRGEAGSDFPLDPNGAQSLREKIAGQLQIIHDLEESAVLQMRDAMS